MGTSNDFWPIMRDLAATLPNTMAFIAFMDIVFSLAYLLAFIGSVAVVDAFLHGLHHFHLLHVHCLLLFEPKWLGFGSLEKNALYSS